MSFLWNKSFETGIDVVDEQHHGLVDLINDAAPVLSSTDPLELDRPERIGRLLDRLFAYAATHFKTEEDLMQQRCVDARHVELHTAEHANFIEQLIELRAALEQDLANLLGPKLLSFLFHWLGAHILDIDQRMADQIHQIDRGVPAVLAYEKAQASPHDQSSRLALISALVDIYSALDERRQAMEHARLMGSYDQMTGLPSRSRFFASLNTASLRAQSERGALALLLVDVDDLSGINQNMGHELADKLLVAIAGRLRDISRHGDLLARTGDDEFALVLAGSTDAAGMQEVIERLYRQLTQPISIDGSVVSFGLSGGIAILPDDAGDAEHLQAAAELAQIRAKRIGGGQCLRFDPSHGIPGFARAEAVQELRNAIANGELVLHYQPQVSLHSGEIVGLEALVRWQHPTRGMVPPGQFIPLAEETGLVIALGDWVIRQAMAQIVEWRDASLPLVRVAVNLSARHFLQPGLPESVEKSLRTLDIDPALFELELTESVMMGDPALAIRISQQLKQIGVRLSLDDYGTGYSSLSYLSRFAIDVLKIDQSFVRDITTNPVNASIAVATIAMAHKLGKTVIAEGVETEGQMTFLRRHDCDELQGYFFSRPVPPVDIAAMFRRGAVLSFAEQSLEDLPCLLVVDDEANILNALKRLLRREGYRILTAQSAAQGLELLAANQVQVVLSDQRMPEMTGTEFLSRVKDIYPKTVRMVLSGYSELSSVTEAINRGAIYKYLSKPWHDDELKNEVRLAFRHQRGDDGKT